MPEVENTHNRSSLSGMRRSHGRPISQPASAYYQSVRGLVAMKGSGEGGRRCTLTVCEPTSLGRYPLELEDAPRTPRNVHYVEQATWLLEEWCQSCGNEGERQRFGGKTKGRKGAGRMGTGQKNSGLASLAGSADRKLAQWEPAKMAA